MPAPALLQAGLRTLSQITPKKSGRTLLKYMVRLDAQAEPEAILETLLSRGAPHLTAATLR